MDKLDLSNFFQTKSQAHDFSLRLAAISEKIYETDFNMEKALMEQFGIRKKDAFLSFLRDNNINAESANSLKTVLSQIQEKIATLPVISLTLAVEPNEQIIKALSDWFLLNIKKHILFNIDVDPHLIAGATLTYGGKYADFSIKPIFDQILKEETNPEKPVVEDIHSYYKKYNATPLYGHQQTASNG